MKKPARCARIFSASSKQRSRQSGGQAARTAGPGNCGNATSCNRSSSAVHGPCHILSIWIVLAVGHLRTASNLDLPIRHARQGISAGLIAPSRCRYHLNCRIFLLVIQHEVSAATNRGALIIIPGKVECCASQTSRGRVASPSKFRTLGSATNRGRRCSTVLPRFVSIAQPRSQCHCARSQSLPPMPQP